MKYLTKLFICHIRVIIKHLETLNDLSRSKQILWKWLWNTNHVHIWPNREIEMIKFDFTCEKKKKTLKALTTFSGPIVSQIVFSQQLATLIFCWTLSFNMLSINKSLFYRLIRCRDSMCTTIFFMANG